MAEELNPPLTNGNLVKYRVDQVEKGLKKVEDHIEDCGRIGLPPRINTLEEDTREIKKKVGLLVTFETRLATCEKLISDVVGELASAKRYLLGTFIGMLVTSFLLVVNMIINNSAHSIHAAAGLPVAH